MKKTFGRVTLPGESNFLEETKDLLERWGRMRFVTATVQSLMKEYAI